MAIKNLKEKEEGNSLPKSSPSVTVRGRGKIDRLLETLAKVYEASHTGRKTRWVFNPANRPELSNLMEREMDGYQIVTREQLGADAIVPSHLQPADPVRVGDLVLMSTSAENKFDRAKELAQRAEDQKRTVDRAYYDEQERVKAVSRDGASHGSTPRGRTTIEEREVDLNRDQRSEEE